MMWRSLSARDIAGMLVVAIILCAFLALLVRYPGLALPGRFGFGPEWECFPAPKGDPVCVKRPEVSRDTVVSSAAAERSASR